MENKETEHLSELEAVVDDLSNAIESVRNNIKEMRRSGCSAIDKAKLCVETDADISDIEFQSNRLRIEFDTMMEGKFGK